MIGIHSEEAYAEASSGGTTVRLDVSDATDASVIVEALHAEKRSR